MTNKLNIYINETIELMNNLISGSFEEFFQITSQGKASKQAKKGARDTLEHFLDNISFLACIAECEGIPPTHMEMYRKIIAYISARIDAYENHGIHVPAHVKTACGELLR